MKFSLTYAGITTMVLGTFLTQYFSESCANEILAYVPLIAGAIAAFVGRFRKGDISVFGFRK